LLIADKGLLFISFLGYDKSVRKIVLFLVFFLFIFLSAKQTALAAACTFDIKEQPLVKGVKTINVSITSGSTLASGDYRVTFYGAPMKADASRGFLYSSSIVNFPNGDAQFIKTFALGLSTGTFKIYVQEKNKSSSDTTNPLCSSVNFTVSPVSSGEQCAVTVTSTNNNFSTKDDVSFKVSFANRNNDTRRVWVYRDGKEVSRMLPKNCYAITDLEKGLNMGKLSAASYSIRIGDGCGLFDSANKACDSSSFTITATGGGPVPVSPPSGLCYSCPAGCTYSDAAGAPACTSSSGGTGTCTLKNNGYCTPPTVCDPNHVFGCADAGGLPIGTSTVPTNPPFCARSLSGGNIIYTCRTAIGDVIASPQGFVTRLFGLILSISGGIALLLIIISGYKILSSQGNPEALKGAKEQLTAAIVGLLFIIFALVILQIIGVDILRIPGFK